MQQKTILFAFIFVIKVFLLVFQSFIFEYFDFIVILISNDGCIVGVFILENDIVSIFEIHLWDVKLGIVFFQFLWY